MLPRNSSLGITRRQALVVAGSAALCVASGSLGESSVEAAQASDKAEPPTGFIDAHVHVWTPDVEKYPLAPGRKVEEMQPASFTPEQLLAHAKPAGVGRIVLIQMSFYGFDNRYMLDTIARFPGVFSGVAVIDETAKPVDEMRRLKKLGVRGLRLAPRNRPVETWLDSDAMQAMWKCGAEDGMAMCHLVNPDALPSIDRMCKKFPETPVVIDHFARVGVDGQFRDRDVDALCDLAKHKRTHVKVSAFYALGKKAAPYMDLGPMTKRLLAAYGRERLMWATDCPYQVNPGHTYADSVALVRDKLEFLSAEDKEWLLRKTAEKVYFG
jgi:predicted TIM-barrel fold metal-dependent hydrolase